MATLSNTFPAAKAFSSSLDVLTWVQSTPDERSVRVEVSHADKRVFAEQLFFNLSDGEVSVRGLNALLWTQLGMERGVYPYEYPTVRISTNGVEVPVRVFPSRVLLSAESVDDWTSKHFLTLHDGIKKVPADAVITLAAVNGAGATKWTCRQLWENGEQYTEVLEPVPDTAISVHEGVSLLTLPVGSLAEPVAFSRLVSLEIMNGGRTARYEIVPFCDNDVTAFEFVNNFGFRETFYAFGLDTVKLEPKYTVTQFARGRRVTAIDGTATHEVKTGDFYREQRFLLGDLLRSKFLRVNGEDAVITDVENKNTNSPYVFSSAGITYELADKQERVRLSADKAAVRVFDETFDQTFE